MYEVDLVAGYKSLGDDVNKMRTTEDNPPEGAVLPLTPELTLDMSDEQIIALTRVWEDSWRSYAAQMKKKQDECENYWKGKQYHDAVYANEERPLMDNLIFESLETFLPEATKQNPEPVVNADNTPEGNELAQLVKSMLIYQADRQVLKLKLKKITRFWSIFFLGVAKISWNLEENDIDTTPLRPQKLILDKDATITEDGTYTGSYIGEYKETSAEELIQMFPDKKSFILAEVDQKAATKLVYIEWWAKDKLFFTLKGTVLGKFKNPHWNYDGEEVRVDEFGNERMEKVRGYNHFNAPQMPYVFMSVFNLGEHPHDDTSLLYQNISNQDLINKRLRQINKNADSMNNGIVVSGDHFTKEQAASAADALAQGDALWVPSGDVRAAIMRDPAQPLPPDVYSQLADMRNELRNIFGVRGSSAQGISSEQTVRGKIITSQKDSSRIGGGVSEYLEQVADRIFNWWVQMFAVYYTEPHYASVIGEGNAQQMVMLSRADLNRKLSVSVKEGSLIPKDSLTQRNEAVDLWNAGALDPVTLFTKLDFPDPEKAAEMLVRWKTDPTSVVGGGQAAPPVAPPEGQIPPDIINTVPIQ